MSNVLERIESKIDQFIEENSAFQAACDRLFLEADKDNDGRLSVPEVVIKVDAIFLELDDALSAAGIQVEKPSVAKIEDLLKKADVDNNDTLDEHEFSLFYRQVLKLAAFNSARGFVSKHGAAIAAGLTSAVALQSGKDKFDIPEEIRPLLNYATPLISIAVGLLAKYGITVKRTNDVEKKLLRSEAFKSPKDD